MRCLLTLLVLCALGVAPASAAATCMQLRGTVVSAADASPVVGAHVYLNATTIGTLTDAEGGFVLDLKRSHPVLDLVVSSLAYEKQRIRLDPATLFPGCAVAVTLEEATFELGPVEVVSISERTARAYRKRAERELLGTTPNGKAARITNLDDIHVTWISEDGEAYHAHSTVPLVIDNTKLDYLLHYTLDALEVHAGQVALRGYSYYEAKSAAPSRRVKRRRAEAYRGSLRHFLHVLNLATTPDDLAEAGYFVYSHGLDVRELYDADPLHPYDLVAADADAGRYLKPQLKVWILYEEESEPRSYKRANAKRGFHTPTHGQYSVIETPAMPVRIAEFNPEIVENVTTYLYMAAERLADEVPLDYTP
ncbi:MAG: carboxypeptidase-like regulatory domain-containing protein [Bacteroidota bacterium]